MVPPRVHMLIVAERSPPALQMTAKRRWCMVMRINNQCQKIRFVDARVKSIPSLPFAVDAIGAIAQRGPARCYDVGQ